jgi:formylglycine-generating enzyme required for sulfatase activity
MVAKAALLVWCVALAACGRIGFDALGDSARGSASDAASILSCIGLAPICGPTGTSSCCSSQLVTGGTFYRSYDVSGDGMYPMMNAPATVSDFRLDTYEVTVGRFRQFVNAGLGTQANPPAAGVGARTLNGMAGQGGWNPADTLTWLSPNTAALETALQCNATYQMWTDSPGPNEALPMNCMMWYEAFAFCVWDGGFLPTEAEWNYAAAGGSDQRPYPWSSPPASLAIDCTQANFNPGTECVRPPNGALVRVGTESPAGDGKYGQADLAGSVYEWNLDWSSTYPTPCNDCANLTVAGARAERGGSFIVGQNLVRTGDRDLATPDHRYIDLGARCARAP